MPIENQVVRFIVVHIKNNPSRLIRVVLGWGYKNFGQSYKSLYNNHLYATYGSLAEATMSATAHYDVYAGYLNATDKKITIVEGGSQSLRIKEKPYTNKILHQVFVENEALRETIIKECTRILSRQITNAVITP